MTYSVTVIACHDATLLSDTPDVYYYSAAAEDIDELLSIVFEKHLFSRVSLMTADDYLPFRIRVIAGVATTPYSDYDLDQYLSGDF